MLVLLVLTLLTNNLMDLQLVQVTIDLFIFYLNITNATPPIIENGI